MSQLHLDVMRVKHGPPADAQIVVSYGGGVNSVAVLVWMSQHGYRPRAIVMADPGSEWPATTRYRDEVMPGWLESVGFPPITVITRAEEGQHRERAWRLERLYDECFRIGSLPSIAYGWKKCSAKYKGETQRWWIARQPWALEEWEAGRTIAKVIGYDADESSRVMGVFPTKWENDRFVAWYPLHAENLDREGCESLIQSVGLALPHKSACTFCPNNTIAEWRQLRAEEPAIFQEAVDMSRNAAPRIDQPDVVGLLRNAPHGQRQLHVWADAGCPRIVGEHENPMPCECAL